MRDNMERKDREERKNNLEKKDERRGKKWEMDEMYERRDGRTAIRRNKGRRGSK
jgi:hypothetical protein